MTTATTAAKVASRTAVTPGTLFFRARDVDRQSTITKRGAVHGRNGFLRFLGCGHGNEGKTTRTAAHPVHHEVGFDHCAVGGKCFLQFIFRCVEGEVPYKQFGAHFDDLVFKSAAFRGLFPTAGFQIITEPSSPEDFP
jgi:hypothetical protein